MPPNGYTVATASQLRGFTPSNGTEDFPGVDVVDYGKNVNTSPAKRQSVLQNDGHFTSDTSRQEETPLTINVHLPSPTETRDDSPESSTLRRLPQTTPSDGAEEPQLLMPVRYSPPERFPKAVEAPSAPGNATSQQDSGAAREPAIEQSSHSNKKRQSRYVGHLSINTKSSQESDDRAHASKSTRRGRSDAIFFTPTDVTRSQIFLSSPVACPLGSPTLPQSDRPPDHSDDDDEQTPTPGKSMSIPPSEMYISPLRPRRPRTGHQMSERLQIKQAQVDQLVKALVKCRFVQKDVRRHWWDDQDMSDEDAVSTVTSVTTPTMTSASTLYSQPNDIFLNHGLSLGVRQAMQDRGRGHGLHDTSQARRLPAAPDVPFGGVALSDPKMHGSPIRFISRGYRVGAHILAVGACSFVLVPYGVDGECNLRIEPPSTFSPSIRVMLQCINQVVERRTGEKSHLLLAEVDVTEHFTQAALAELSHTSGTPLSSIDIVPSPTSSTASPDIDWLALADELQAHGLAADTLEATLSRVPALTAETCAPATLTLLASLDRLRDQHHDFLLLRPTAYHATGVPRTVRLPWCSRRLHRDWYATVESAGFSPAARRFQEAVVKAVAKRAPRARAFTVRVPWDRDRLAVRCVPLTDGSHAEGRGTADVWVCFVQGMLEPEGEGAMSSRDE